MTFDAPAITWAEASDILGAVAALFATVWCVRLMIKLVMK